MTNYPYSHHPDDTLDEAYMRWLDKNGFPAMQELLGDQGCEDVVALRSVCEQERLPKRTGLLMQPFCRSARWLLFGPRRVTPRASDIWGYLIHMDFHTPSTALERLGQLPALVFEALSDGVRVSVALHAASGWRIEADRHFYRHAIRRQAMELLKPYGLDLGDHDNLGLGMSGLILRLSSGEVLRVWHSSDGELPLAESEPMRMFCKQNPTAQGRLLLDLPGIEESDGGNLAILWDDDGSVLTRFELVRPYGLEGKRVLVDWHHDLLSCHGEREDDLDYGVEDGGATAGLEG